MLATTMLYGLADASSAADVMRSFVTPVVHSMCVVASLVCVFFLVNGGLQYITSSGKPEKLEHAKRIIRNALIGLVIVLAATVLTAILTHAYTSSSSAMSQKLPVLTAIQPKPVSNGLVDVLIKAITGLLNNIIQSIAAPFLKALSFFTRATPLMAANSSVFNLWLAIVGITDVLFVLALALLGFHIMGAATFGFNEVEFKNLLPRVGLVFLMINCSIFAIDGVIELSNAIIRALDSGLASNSVWNVLTDVVKQSSGLGVAALLIMVAFLILAVILLIYYVCRIVTLYIGAVLSPIVVLLWLLPGFRDFSESAAKTYLTTIFVLLVHVVILQLAASLFAGLVVGSPNHTPDTLMALIVGLATVIALLRTQGVMMRFSYASLGPRTARNLSGQFLNGVTYLSSKNASSLTKVANISTGRISATTNSPAKRNLSAPDAKYTQPKSSVKGGSPQPTVKATTQSKPAIKPNSTKSNKLKGVSKQ
jgi:hypothetical protein